MIAASSGVAIRKFLAYRVEHGIVRADRLTDDKRFRVFECLADFLATGNFPYAGMAGIIFQDDHIPRKKWPMCSAEIQQHAVMAGDGDDEHFGDDRRAHGVF